MSSTFEIVCTTPFANAVTNWSYHELIKLFYRFIVRCCLGYGGDKVTIGKSFK